MGARKTHWKFSDLERLAVKRQLKNTLKFLEKSMKIIESQRNALQIERFHLENMKTRLQAEHLQGNQTPTSEQTLSCEVNRIPSVCLSKMWDEEKPMNVEYLEELNLIVTIPKLDPNEEHSEDETSCDDVSGEDEPAHNAELTCDDGPSGGDDTSGDDSSCDVDDIMIDMNMFMHADHESVD